MSRNSMRINPLIEGIIAKKGLDRTTTLLNIFAAIYLGDDGLSMLVDKDMIDKDQENTLRLHFLNFDYETEEYHERMPLFVSTEATNYQEYLGMLLNRGMRVDGMPHKGLAYNVLEDNEQTNEAFQRLKLRMGRDFDINILVECTIRYYNENERPKKLVNYLNEVAIIDLRSFEQSDTFRGAWYEDDEL